MDHFEMVEKLRERTGVSYEEAKAALEATNWDLLDAIVLLESEGKVAEGAKDYSTRREEARSEASDRKCRGEFKSTVGRIGQQIVNLVEWGNKVYVDASRNNKPLFSLPLTVVAILMVVTWPWAIPLLIVSLFFGFGYKVRSEDGKMDMVNQAMDKASEMANNLKQEAVNNHHGDDKQ